MESSIDTAVEKSDPGPSASELLAMMPYGREFLFIDEFLEVDRSGLVARYRFRENEFFYAYHFADSPVTPGVMLLEAMCQCGMVAQGLYLLALEKDVAHANCHRFLVTGSEVEWLQQVRPGDCVTMHSQLRGWRQRRIRTSVKMFSEAGALVAEAKISGMGVLWSPEDSQISSRTPVATSTKI